MASEGADAPVEGSDVPVEGEDAPVECEDVPVEDEDAPVEGKDAPIQSEDAPIPDKLERLLRDESHKIVLNIPLESFHLNRSRHLVIVSAPVTKLIEDLRFDNEEPATLSRMSSAYGKMTRNSKTMDLDYCLLGVDTFMKDGEEVIGLGFVLKILWGTETSLDGDGGFGVHILNKHYMFKPVSLQFLWTAIQTLYAISARLRPKRNSICVMEQDWVRSYEDHIESPQSCINEWNEMTDILSRRPLSPDDLTVLSSDAASAETMKTIIKSKLREIMKTVDLDDITSKTIRVRLEAELDQKLDEFKAFIDEEILLILGQMDPASEIFDFMYLGSEWNASNLEELNANGITHILNVTREIDNFFPAVFKYMNIREYDVEETDLLKYWDKTYNFVADCIELGGKVLIHCKMGISRSASTVCSFAMKHFGWSLEHALAHTKENRSIINPNMGFRHQLDVYEGILQASRQRLSFRKQQRSKSETSVKRKDDLTHLSEPVAEISPGSQPSTPSPIACHCYSQLSAHTAACPSPISGYLPNRRQKSAKRFYSLPGQEDTPEATGVEDAEVEELTDSERVCPSQSNLSQCTCNLELELAVSEKPVDIFEQTPETDIILRNLGNLPIHIRQAQNWSSSRLNPSQEQKAAPKLLELFPVSSDLPDLDFSVINQEDQNNEIKLDTAGAEELSVKTLANMFDFRQTDSCIAKNEHKMRESKMNKIAQEMTINVTNYSEC